MPPNRSHRRLRRKEPAPPPYTTSFPNGKKESPDKLKALEPHRDTNNRDTPQKTYKTPGKPLDKPTEKKPENIAETAHVNYLLFWLANFRSMLQTIFVKRNHRRSPAREPPLSKWKRFRRCLPARSILLPERCPQPARHAVLHFGKTGPAYAEKHKDACIRQEIAPAHFQKPQGRFPAPSRTACRSFARRRDLPVSICKEVAFKASSLGKEGMFTLMPIPGITYSIFPTSAAILDLRYRRLCDFR